VFFLYVLVAIAALTRIVEGTGAVWSQQEARYVFAVLAVCSIGALLVLTALVIAGFRRAYFLAIKAVSSTDAPEYVRCAVELARRVYLRSPLYLIWIPFAILTGYIDLFKEPSGPNPRTEFINQITNLIMMVALCRYVMLLSGTHRMSSLRLCKLRTSRFARKTLDVEAAAGWTAGCGPWDAKVRDLAARGITVRALLQFYRTLGTDGLMPHFDAEAHTTADVVRQAIIPQSRGQGYRNGALATAMMGGRETVPQHMVTHSWSNRFSHLVAAVVAHALGTPTFGQILPRLSGDELRALESELFWKGTLDETYWICAFAVDQHASICEAVLPADVDIVTGMPHPTCQCGAPKFASSAPPTRQDGQSIPCEMNKFDDMIEYLRMLQPDFSLVVAVDEEFRLFQRAWCVAELYTAHELGMAQSMKVISEPCLAGHEAELRQLRVEDMRSSNPADKDMILAKIEDKSAFNAKLAHVIFDKEGLLSRWKDGCDMILCLGDLARRQYDLSRGLSDSQM